MRFSEFANSDLEQDLVLLFRNQIQRANADDSTAELSYQAITNLMKASGHGAFDYGVFKNLYDTSDAVKAVPSNEKPLLTSKGDIIISCEFNVLYAAIHS